MGFSNLIFILLLFAVFLAPLIFSFNRQIRFFEKLKYLVPTVIFTGAIFVIWGVRFVQLDIFTFNLNYITGINLLKFPLEEWLLFFVFSYSGLFVYEWLQIRFKNFEKPNVFLAISLIILVVSGLTAYFSRQKLFTFFTFFLLAVYFGYTIFRNRFKPYYTKFYLAYLVLIIPFLFVKGVLLNIGAIGYHPEHIIGWNLFKIPIEIFAYLFLLLLMNISIFEYLKERRFY